MPIPRSNTPAKLSVDFSGAEVRRGGGGDRVPEGDYLMQVTGVTHEQKKDDPSRFYLRWKLVIVEPKSQAGKTVYNNTSLVKENLWQLRTFLVDLLGEDKVPQKAVDLPLAKIVSVKPKIGVTLKDGAEYPAGSGKIKSEVAQTFSKSEWTATQSDDTEEEEEEAADAVTSDDGEDMDEIDVDDL